MPGIPTYNTTGWTTNSRSQNSVLKSKFIYEEEKKEGPRSEKPIYKATARPRRPAAPAMLAARAVARGAALGVLVWWEPPPVVGVAPGVPVALGK